MPPEGNEINTNTIAPIPAGVSWIRAPWETCLTWKIKSHFRRFHPSVSVSVHCT